MKLEDIIKNYRRNNHMTQIEFAKRAHVSKGYVSILELGVRRADGKMYHITPTVNICKRLARAMDMDVDKLVAMIGTSKFSEDPLSETVSVDKKAVISVYNSEDIKMTESADYLALPKQFPFKTENCFAIPAPTDVNEHIKRNDIVIFEKCNDIESILEMDEHIACIISNKKMNIVRIEKTKQGFIVTNDEMSQKGSSYISKDVKIVGKKVYSLSFPIIK